MKPTWTCFSLAAILAGSLLAGCAGAPTRSEAPGAPALPTLPPEAAEPTIPPAASTVQASSVVPPTSAAAPAPALVPVPVPVPVPAPEPTRLVAGEAPLAVLRLPAPHAPVGEPGCAAVPPDAPAEAGTSAPGVADGPSAEPAAPRFPIPDRPEIGAVVDEFCGSLSRAVGDALQRGERYLPMIRSILAEEGLPEELAYLALVESAFHPHARSPAAAVGLWQFIESTGRASGLRIDWWVDERLDPEAATRAAARHLKELYARFADWDLALAAYNAGAGGVGRALTSRGAEGFWELSAAGGLRAETRRYVPKFYAAVRIAQDPEAHGFAPPGSVAPIRYETVWVDSPIDLRTAARVSGANLETLRRLNPALQRGCTPPGTQDYPLRVPAGTASLVAERLAAIPLADRLTFRRYQIRPGDTLWEIARAQGAPAKAVAELNDIADPRRLRPGQELVIPTLQGAPRVANLKAASVPTDRDRGIQGSHVVRSGETVWGIARARGVSAEDLLRWNGLDRRAVVRPGDALALRPGRTPQARGADSRVHVVREGESLWAISRRYGVSLSQLLERNGLRPSVVLRPGDRLVVGVGEDDPS